MRKGATTATTRSLLSFAVEKMINRKNSVFDGPRYRVKPHLTLLTTQGMKALALKMEVLAQRSRISAPGMKARMLMRKKTVVSVNTRGEKEVK